MQTLKHWWERWKAFGQKIADFQARLLLILFYFILLAPFGMLLRLLSDPLMVKSHTPQSMWLPKQLPDATIENARRQF